MKSCPHENIANCPLYVASHYPYGEGCMDGHEADGRCAVARGMNYKAQKKRIAARDPVLVAQCEAAEAKLQGCIN